MRGTPPPFCDTNDIKSSPTLVPNPFLPPDPVDFVILATSIIDGSSLIKTFIDPLHAEFGTLGAGGDAEAKPLDETEDDGLTGRERAAEASRADAVSAAIAGAGKLGARPPPKEAPKASASLFGGWGR